MTLTSFALLLLVSPQSSSPCEIDRLSTRFGGPGDRFGIQVAAEGDYLLAGGGGVLPSSYPTGGQASRTLVHHAWTGTEWFSTFDVTSSSSGSTESFYPAMDTDGVWIAFASSNQSLLEAFQPTALSSPQVWSTPLPFPQGSDQHWVRDVELASDRVYVLYDESDGVAMRSYLLEYDLPDLILLSATQVGSPSTLSLSSSIELAGGLTIVGDRLFVGLPGDDSIQTDVGSVRVLQQSAQGPVEVQQIFAAFLPPHSRFGADLEVSGDALLVGASGAFAPLSVGERALVFRDDGAGWLLEAELDLGPRDGSSGLAVDLKGDLAAVGLPGNVELVPGAAGEVRTFRFNAGLWTPDHSIQALQPQAGDRFGADLGFLASDRLAVGAPRDGLASPTRGAVSVYSLSGTGCASTLVSPIDGAKFFPLSIDLAMNGGPGLAGDLAIVLASATSPGSGIALDGVSVPLTPDALTFAALNAPGAFGFQNFVTQLDGEGRSELPSVATGLPPIGLWGTDLFFTWISLELEPASVFVQAAGEARSISL